MFIREKDKEDLKLLEKILKTKLPESNNVWGCFSVNGFALIGYVNYYDSTDIELFVYGSGQWLTKQLLNKVFTYVFGQLKCKRCTLKMLKNNQKAINLAERLGFIKECELRGINTFLYSMLKSECKYYE